jgi:hypothetical protein
VSVPESLQFFVALEFNEPAVVIALQPSGLVGTDGIAAFVGSSANWHFIGYLAELLAGSPQVAIRRVQFRGLDGQMKSCCLCQ